jgi:hypothetical protein
MKTGSSVLYFQFQIDPSSIPLGDPAFPLGSPGVARGIVAFGFNRVAVKASAALLLLGVAKLATDW